MEMISKADLEQYKEEYKTAYRVLETEKSQHLSDLEQSHQKELDSLRLKQTSEFNACIKSYEIDMVQITSKIEILDKLISDHLTEETGLE